MEKQKKDFKEFLRALKFTLISISAGIIQIGLFTVMNELLTINYWVAYLTSLLASILWNFTINRKITFKSANNVKIAMLLVLAFYAVFTPVSTILGELAENSGVNEYIVLAVTMISNFVLEYLFTRFVVYRNSCDTATTTKTTGDVGSDTENESSNEQ
jgi:putative flippase GtrA